jgi:hypothetical protein
VVPLNFESMDDEINFWALAHLLNFGSGYRHELHDAGGKVRRTWHAAEPTREW